MSNLPDERIYYAQNREDLILESFFEHLKTGFYVDVGACHPDIASVTKRFYLNGWHGINIEPQTELHNLFVSERKRDINLNIGISDKEGSLTLRTYIDNQGMSTAAPDVMQEHESDKANRTENYRDVEVPVSTLKAILEQHKVRSIQFLKVDVEGYEYQVLAGNDWVKYRPEVICVEADHIVKDWRPLLQKNDYTKVFFDGLNEYYADVRTDAAKRFNFIKHVLLNLKGGIAGDDYEKIQELESLSAGQKQIIGELQMRVAKQAEDLGSIRALIRKVTLLTLGKAKRAPRR